MTYDSAIAQLATQPAGGRVLGDVLRALLEDTHPDGFGADDIVVVIGNLLLGEVPGRRSWGRHRGVGRRLCGDPHPQTG